MSGAVWGTGSGGGTSPGELGVGKGGASPRELGVGGWGVGVTLYVGAGLWSNWEARAW